jgi:hypothetical protein
MATQTTKPLDQVKDFDAPARRELVPENKEQEAAVREGFALCKFVSFGAERDKHDKAFISFNVSLPLTEEHEKWIPDDLRWAWEAVEEHDSKISQAFIPNQVAEIRVAPDATDGSIKIGDAEIESAAISKITEKGTGEEREVIRLQMRLRMEMDTETARFARVHFGHNVWLKLHELQGKLIE